MKLLLLIPLILALAIVGLLLTSAKARGIFYELGYRLSQMVFGYMARNGLVLFGFNFPEGTRFYFCGSDTFAGAKTISAVTNADPALATSVGHGYVDNDEVMFTSGWEDATNAIYRLNQTSVDAFEFLGLNSTSTRFFPAGSGTGTTQKVGTWVTIPQVTNIQTSGGDPRFTDVQLLASRNQLKIPTGFNAVTTVLTLAHDPADANWLSMIDISRALLPVGFKMALGGGGTTYGYGYMAVNESPKMNVNQVNTVDVTFAFLGRQYSYAT